MKHNIAIFCMLISSFAYITTAHQAPETTPIKYLNIGANRSITVKSPQGWTFVLKPGDSITENFPTATLNKMVVLSDAEKGYRMGAIISSATRRIECKTDIASGSLIITHH